MFPESGVLYSDPQCIYKFYNPNSKNHKIEKHPTFGGCLKHPFLVLGPLFLGIIMSLSDYDDNVGPKLKNLSFLILGAKNMFKK